MNTGCLKTFGRIRTQPKIRHRLANGRQVNVASKVPARSAIECNDGASLKALLASLRFKRDAAAVAELGEGLKA